MGPAGKDGGRKDVREWIVIQIGKAVLLLE
jgi:hypothetical protein